MTNQRRVVCAANRGDGHTVLGARHFDALMHEAISNIQNPSSNPGDWEQGFIDQFGVFMTRQEAFEVATAAGQIIRRVGGDDGVLYSENLY